LEIVNTKIKSIGDNTFSKAKFGKIIIYGNEHLSEIKATAFNITDETTELVIRDNKILDESSLFTLVDRFKKNIVIVDFSGNNIKKIKQNTFTGFPKLETLMLDHQTRAEGGITVDTKAFNDLPKLKELNLNDNFLNMSKGSIDLTTRNLEHGEHLNIFLKSCDLVIGEEIYIIPPNSTTDATFTVDLKYNKIEVLKDGLINNLSSKGIVFLTPSGAECNCENIPEIVKSLKTSNNIQGIYHGHPCIKEGNKTVTIDQC